MKKLFITFYILFIGLIQNSAWACSCAAFPEGLNILSGNAAVFSGKAMEVINLEPEVTYVRSDLKYETPIIRVTFKVDEVWKGPVRSTILLSTLLDEGMCNGHNFKQGQSYLVAADNIILDDRKADIAEIKGIYVCGGTRRLENAAEDTKALGEGQRPKKTKSE